MGSQNDPLFAAGTPIAVDPQLGPARPRGAVTRQEMIARLVAAGHTPEDAAKIVDAEIARSGPRPREMFDEDNTPQGNAALAQRVQRGNRTADRQARFEAHYNDVTGAPVSQAAVPAMPAEEPDVSPEEIRAAGFMAQAEPGQRTAGGGSKVPQGRQFTKMSEAAGYVDRVPVTDANRNMAQPDAAFMPSQRDRDMMARGMFPVYSPDGSVSYSVGTNYESSGMPQTGGRTVPGTPGRVGVRQDLEDAGWELRPVQGPTGTVYAYRPGEELNKKIAARNEESQLARFANASGLSESELRAMTPEGRREAVRGAKRNDANARRDAWRSQMMLAGSNGRKNAVNAYNQLGDPNVSDWQKLTLATRLGVGVDGVTPIGAEAAHNAQLTKLGLAVATGQGFQHMDPAQQQLLQQKINSGKPPQVLASEAVAAGRMNDPAIMQHADDLVHQHYSSRPGALGVSTHFTDNEVMIAAQRLADDTGMPVADAEKVMRRIQQDRNQNTPVSTIGGWMYNQ